jgi:hypothetical protein
VQDGDGDAFAQVDLGAFEVPEPGAALSGLVALLCLLALRSRQRQVRGIDAARSRLAGLRSGSLRRNGQ